MSSLPRERVSAVFAAHQLLIDLLDRGYRPGWTELRERARRVLEHFPGHYELITWGEEEKREVRDRWEP